MPDDDLQDQEQESTIEVQQKAGGGNKTVIIMLVLSIFVMVITPIVTVFAVKNFMPKPDEEAKKAKQELFIHKIPGITVNVGGTMAGRFLQSELVIEYNKKDVGLFFGERTQENPNGILYKIKAEINAVLSSKTMDALTAPDAQRVIANEIKNKLNDMLEKKTEGRVTAVFFSKFLIQ